MYKASPNQTKGLLSSRYEIRRFLKMKCLVFGTSFIPLQILEAQVTGWPMDHHFQPLRSHWHRLGVKIQMFRHLSCKNQLQVPVKGWLKDACDGSFPLKNSSLVVPKLSSKLV